MYLVLNSPSTIAGVPASVRRACSCIHTRNIKGSDAQSGKCLRGSAMLHKAAPSRDPYLAPSAPDVLL